MWEGQWMGVISLMNLLLNYLYNQTITTKTTKFLQN